MGKVRKQCGELMACRYLTEKTYELTMSHPRGKERLMEGVKIGETRLHARELNNDERVVSFLSLPFYIDDGDIYDKLRSWGVSPVSPIKRRMWPGTKVADGTRFLRVRFNEAVQSLPYSTKFATALGSEFFRVLHDLQLKTCRMCMQPGHIQRECPEFTCHRCGGQGHYSRECAKEKEKHCAGCGNAKEECGCPSQEEVQDSAPVLDTDLEDEEGQEGEEQVEKNEGGADGEEICMESSGEAEEEAADEGHLINFSKHPSMIQCKKRLLTLLASLCP